MIRCPACGQAIAYTRALLVKAHVFAGDTPTYWLRPGEACPGSGVGPDDLNEIAATPAGAAWDLERQLYAAERRLFA